MGRPRSKGKLRRRRSRRSRRRWVGGAKTTTLIIENYSPGLNITGTQKLRRSTYGNSYIYTLMDKKKDYVILYEVSSGKYVLLHTRITVDDILKVKYCINDTSNKIDLFTKPEETIKHVHKSDLPLFDATFYKGYLNDDDVSSEVNKPFVKHVPYLFLNPTQNQAYDEFYKLDLIDRKNIIERVFASNAFLPLLNKLGVQCFASSSIQMLWSLKDLIKDFIINPLDSGLDYAIEENEIQKTMHCVFALIVTELNKKSTSLNLEDNISIIFFKWMGYEAEDPRVIQQDASEFLNKVLNALCENNNVNKNLVALHWIRNRTFFEIDMSKKPAALESGKHIMDLPATEREPMCTKKDYIDPKTKKNPSGPKAEPSLQLELTSLMYDDAAKTSDGIAIFQSVIDLATTPQESKTNPNIDIAEQKCDYTTEHYEVPDEVKYLIISKKLFSFDGTGNKKELVNTVPETITINGKTFKRLTCIIHLGSTLTGGHYVAVSFDNPNNGTHTLISDSRSNEYSEANLKKQHYDISKAYIYTYERIP